MATMITKQEKKTLKIKSSFTKGNQTVWKTISEIRDFFPVNFDFVIDFREFQETKPYNTLLIGNELKNIKQQVYKGEVLKRDETYLENIGFYDLIGVRGLGRKIGEARATDSYVPITKIQFNYQLPSPYAQIIEKSTELANILRFDDDLAYFIKYIFIEMIRNVYEHAATDTIYVCGQKYLSKKYVELAFLDNRCGILNSLKNRHHVTTDLEALELCMSPGISSCSNHKWLEDYPGEESFKNSGYGLYLVKELCLKYNGHFKIASGGYQLTYFKDQIYRRKIHFQGTAICVDIGIRKMSNFEDVIKELNSKAESLAKGKNKTIKKASASSLGYYNDKK